MDQLATRYTFNRLFSFRRSSRDRFFSVHIIPLRVQQSGSGENVHGSRLMSKGGFDFGLLPARETNPGSLISTVLVLLNCILRSFEVWCAWSVSMEVELKGGVNEALQGMAHAIREWLIGRTQSARHHQHLTKSPPRMDLSKYKLFYFVKWTGSIPFCIAFP